ncbi:MAG: type II secretion system inner membrane protein GspF [Myxococcaceae bacterium]|nr:type II secretion system inner membrane protein GspF [Myxococcaceae bacterium]
MAVYEFKGLNQAGKTITGLKEADSPRTLKALLRKEGVFLTDVVGQSEGKSNRAPLKGAAAGKGGKGAAETLNQDVNLKRFTRGSINTDDIAIMTRQLATLLGAGVALVEALSALVDQVDKERLKVLLSDVKSRVNEGSGLADAMTQHEKVFGKLYINMVRAGEHSGALDAVLTRLAEFTESQARLKQKVIGTMMYPLVMVVIGGGIMILLLTVVVPKVTKIFADMKTTLPWTTRLLIASSNFMADWWFVVVPALVLTIVFFLRWTSSEKGKPVWDRIVLRLPLAGGLVRMLAVARFTRTLATLLKSGVPIITAMDIVRNVVTNDVLAGVIEKARDSIREGESIAAPLKRSGEFPPLVYHMVAIGEKSGQLEDMLVNVADSYESQVNVRIGALTSLLEPIMIVIMACGVGFVAFSILMPIMQMNSAIK